MLSGNNLFGFSKDPNWQRATVLKKVIEYSREDLDDCGFSEIENWQIDDLEVWDNRFDVMTYD